MGNATTLHSGHVSRETERHDQTRLPGSGRDEPASGPDSESAQIIETRPSEAVPGNVSVGRGGGGPLLAGRVRKNVLGAAVEGAVPAHGVPVPLDGGLGQPDGVGPGHEARLGGLVKVLGAARPVLASRQTSVTPRNRVLSRGLRVSDRLRPVREGSVLGQKSYVGKVSVVGGSIFAATSSTGTCMRRFDARLVRFLNG